MQVADLIKSDRINRLNAVVNRVAEERAQRFAGRVLELLGECSPGGSVEEDWVGPRAGVGGARVWAVVRGVGAGVGDAGQGRGECCALWGCQQC